tara:strand:+ start:178 stop:315 length:138 start_codon:yes stop_codon:yes gene_type:complete
VVVVAEQVVHLVQSLTVMVEMVVQEVELVGMVQEQEEEVVEINLQ